jgi:ankyrin repeat protein
VRLFWFLIGKVLFWKLQQDDILFRPRKNLGDRGMSIYDRLIDACREGDLSTVKECIERRANIHVENDYALRLAAERGHLEVVECLIENGADIHAKKDYALRWAAYHGYLEVVKCLIKQGADIHAEKDFALRFAAKYGHLQVANVLRKAAGDAYKCHRCIIKSTCLELCKGFRQR